MSKKELDVLAMGIDAVERDEKEYCEGVIWTEEEGDVISCNLRRYDELKHDVPEMEKETDAFYELVENACYINKNVLRMISILLNKQEDINAEAKEQMEDIASYLATKNIYV